MTINNKYGNGFYLYKLIGFYFVFNDNIGKYIYKYMSKFMVLFFSFKRCGSLSKILFLFLIKMN